MEGVGSGFAAYASGPVHPSAVPEGSGVQNTWPFGLQANKQSGG